MTILYKIYQIAIHNKPDPSFVVILTRSKDYQSQGGHTMDVVSISFIQNVHSKNNHSKSISNNKIFKNK